MLTKKQKAWCAAHRGPASILLKDKGPTFGRIFVAMPDGFLCQTCTCMLEIDVGSDDVDVWEVGSAGWLAPCVCSECRLSIPVVCDGNRT